MRQIAIGPRGHFVRRPGGDIESTLSRRRIAFSHDLYFFLTVAFALIAVVALTLRFAGGRRFLKSPSDQPMPTTQNSSGRLRVIWSAIAAALDLLFFLSMIWSKAPKPSARESRRARHRDSISSCHRCSARRARRSLEAACVENRRTIQ
jgi:hypothetical protein